MFLVVGHQVCTHLWRDFVPLLFADPLQFTKVLRLTFGNSNLQLPPQIFYGIKVWRLARPLQDLNVLLLGPLLCCLGRVFRVIFMLKYPSLTHFQCPSWLQWPGPDVHGPVHRPFDVVQLCCPFSRKTPQSIMFPPPCLTVGMVFLGSQAAFLLLQTQWVELMPKSWILVSSDQNTFTQFPSESLANFRRACTCAFLSRGPCGRCRISVLQILLIDRGSNTYLTH